MELQPMTVQHIVQNKNSIKSSSHGCGFFGQNSSIGTLKRVLGDIKNKSDETQNLLRTPNAKQQQQHHHHSPKIQSDSIKPMQIGILTTGTPLNDINETVPSTRALKTPKLPSTIHEHNTTTVQNTVQCLIPNSKKSFDAEIINEQPIKPFDCELLQNLNVDIFIDNILHGDYNDLNHLPVLPSPSAELLKNLKSDNFNTSIELDENLLNNINAEDFDQRIYHTDDKYDYVLPEIFDDFD